MHCDAKAGMEIRGALRSPCQLPAETEPIIVGKIDGETDWTAALREVDVVIHLAARVHVMNDTAADPVAEF